MLIHNAKLPKSFNSCCWKRGYNPDLCFVSQRLAHLSEKAVLKPLPRLQHQPITINPPITKSEVPFRRHFNLKKAKWNGYKEGMDKALLDVEPTADNYSVFVQAVKKIAHTCIPSGCRKEHRWPHRGLDPFSDTTSELGDTLNPWGRRGGKPGKI